MRPAQTADARTVFPILYTNWRGETAVRRICLNFIAYGNEALGFGFGSNEWHPEPQMLLSAIDVDKGERRTFALSGIKAWGEEAVSAALASTAGAGAWVTVPRRPLPEMLGAFWRVKNTGSTEPGEFGEDRSDVAAYRAMIEAAPAVLASPKSGVSERAWMQTYSLPRFFPLDPDPASILIEDIAHHLSQAVRYGGAGIRFLSVAEHSVHLANHCLRCADGTPDERRTLALWALLHDASEAYLHDVVRPVKRALPGYAEAEDRIMRAVCQRFGLPPEMPREIKALDNRIVIDERAQNMRPSDVVWTFGGETEPLGITLAFWSPEQAEREFLATFAAITSQSPAVPASPRAGAGEGDVPEVPPAARTVIEEVAGLFPASDDSVGFTPFEDWRLRLWKAFRVPPAPAEHREDGRFWLELREPRRVPERKGPWPARDAAKILREFMAARPEAYITVVRVGHDGPSFSDGPETLQMADARSMTTGTRHMKSTDAAHDGLRPVALSQGGGAGRSEKGEGEGDWRGDPSADERWNDGLDYGMTQFCAVLGVDPQKVTWDAATETVSGDVRAVICNILNAWAGDDWRDRPKEHLSSTAIAALREIKALQGEQKSDKYKKDRAHLIACRALGSLRTAPRSVAQHLGPGGLTMTSDDAFMALAGVRYCLGRHSYAPSLCCDWLKGRWSDLSEGDRAVILRDINSHIADEDQSATGTWDIDTQTWRNFAAWAQSPTPSPDTTGAKHG